MYKLLLADDSLTIQKVVELVLAEEHFDIKTVNDGEQALEAVTAFGPHIVLADIEMPKLNGYQLCEKIKNNTATVHLPVILLTGAFEPFDEEYAKAVGADDFIVKPFESQELISKVKSLLVGVEPQAGAAGQEMMQDEVSVTPEADLSSFMEEPAAEAGTKVEAEGLGELKVTLDEQDEPQAAFASSDKGFEDDLALALGSDETPPAVGTCGMIDTLELPTRDDIQDIIKQSVEKRVCEIIGSDILPVVSEAIKQDVSATLAQNAPKVIEDVTKELVTGMMQSLQGQIAAAINRIVPDVAEKIIRKEIDKITAQS